MMAVFFFIAHKKGFLIPCATPNWRLFWLSYIVVIKGFYLHAHPQPAHIADWGMI